MESETVGSHNTAGRRIVENLFESTVEEREKTGRRKMNSFDCVCIKGSGSYQKMKKADGREKSLLLPTDCLLKVKTREE